MVLVESKPRIKRVHTAHRVDLRKSTETVLREAAFVLEMTRRVKESILTDSALPFERDEARAPDQHLRGTSAMDSIYELPRTAFHMNPAINRFESWLRGHGYEPMHDPFMNDLTSDDQSDHAPDLVDEYLHDRPHEEPNRQVLLEHARLLGDVTCLWGDGVGLALAG